MSTSERVTLDELRRIDLFDGLDDTQLAEWTVPATVETFADGTMVLDADTEALGLLLLFEGVVDVLIPVGNGFEPGNANVAPTWIGAIPTLTSGINRVRLTARGDVRLATIPREPLVDLVRAHRPVFERIMRQIQPVLGRVAAMEQNRERLASLGTMAAGLAHELNNPASAAKRAAADLAETLDVLDNSVARFVESGVEREDAAKLLALKQELRDRAAAHTPLAALDAADAEDELSDALEALGVAEPWRWAEPLAAAGADEAWLRRLAEHAGPALEGAVSWVAASLQARGLTAELADSTERMSTLVGAVKSYAFMDRGTLVQTDVHEGIEMTLKILGHKLKHSSIEVKRSYDKTLPQITVHGGEVNQVWTNLLDNAIDSLCHAGGEGTISISTRREGDCVVVDLADDGPGIPADVLPRIFDPFFTTKEVGSGTGLGLDTARRIVVDRHKGSLTVDSRPGATAFHVWLPIGQKR
ncbi:sensor histidine kinase [Conexibacter woesei]|uniref:histidine kinase n=1 Tax=Conexibacter woesei (strain DSM 14684 / CCUG 47730 / CIP 108061 / JCM 11494 / NBRC 100937 / ID131577) TaxID=469383 RepID=D3FDP6_CONWI|nr:ATP-binding protein [Conexibacter woesei]ADB49620.1 histidine kinase [Conexibacter woesei DSM 14684]